MSKNYLRTLTIIIPIIFWVTIFILSGFLYGDRHRLPEIIFSGVAAAMGATLFSFWVFRYINQREDEIRRRAEQLQALNLASMALTTELEIDAVLQKVVDLSAKLGNARFGALGVLSGDGKYFEQFVSSGIPDYQLNLLDNPPDIQGFFKELIMNGKPILIDNISKHKLARGFPKNHPIMTTLLGVPIISKGKVIGDLYLADKISPTDPNLVDSFDISDQQILEMFATQAAIAIENANLYRQVQELVVLRERERFGMDLHDGIIQSIYAVGLMLDDIKIRMIEEPDQSKARISKAIIGLNDVISDLRNYILDLRPQKFQGKNLIEGLEELSRSLRANTLINVNLDVDNVYSDKFTPEQTVETLHIAQEAITNIRKHARASTVHILVEINDDHLILNIEDNGISITNSEMKNQEGNGLRNMHERAVSLGGSIEISSIDDGGTRVRLSVPLDKLIANLL